MRITTASNAEASLRVLVLAPMNGIDQLAPGGELDLLTGAVRDVAHVDALTGTVTWAEFSDALQDGHYGVLHVIAHGDASGWLISGEYWPWGQFAAGIRLAQVGLLVSMTCQSGGFADGLVEAGVPCVVATVGNVPGDAAGRFTRVFYRSLAGGDTPRSAFALALSRLAAEERQLFRIAPLEVQLSPMLQAVERILGALAAHDAQLSTVIGELAALRDDFYGLTQAVISFGGVIARQNDGRADRSVTGGDLRAPRAGARDPVGAGDGGVVARGDGKRGV